MLCPLQLYGGFELDMEAVTRLQDEETTTPCKCEWIIPSYLKNVEYLPVKDIDFTSKGKRKLDEAQSKKTYEQVAQRINPSVLIWTHSTMI